MTFSNEPVVAVKGATIFQDHSTVLERSEVSRLARGEFIYLVGSTGSGKDLICSKPFIADLDLHTLATLPWPGYQIKKPQKKSKVPSSATQVGDCLSGFPAMFQDRSVADNIYFIMQATGWKDRSKMKNKTG